MQLVLASVEVPQRQLVANRQDGYNYTGSR